MFLLKTLWKVEQVLSCLQLFNWSHETWLVFAFVKSLYVQTFFVIKNLVTPIMSLRFLFLLNAKIGGSAKISFNFGSICKICQFLSITVLTSGRVLLYVTVSGKRSVLDVLILFSNSFLGIEIARLICVVVCFLL